MTLEREAYLAKCSNREAWLRSAIRATKRDISYQKQRISNANEEWIATGAKCELWNEKQLLMTLRHELNRLKGMDRVAVPKQTKHEVLPKTTSRPAIMSKPYFVCKCGDIVGFMIGNEWQKATYCTHCGRRILWEKVK